MPKTTQSFSYQVDHLNFNDYRCDYFNAIVGRYQDIRSTYMNQNGGLDDIQLVKERYTDYPVFISHQSPPNDKSNKTLLFANRANGYFAYTDSIVKSKEDPFYHFTIKTVVDFPEYLSHLHKTENQGLFYLNNQLCGYATISNDDVKLSLSIGDFSLLYFCDSFTYEPSKDENTGRVGIAKLNSPYYTQRTLHIYSKDSLATLPKYTVYATISTKDPHPTDKIPGEPIYKTLTITQFDSSVTKVKIGGKTITLSSDVNKVIVGSDERFTDNYLGVRYTGSGIFEIGFSLPYKPDPLEIAVLDISLFINNSWADKQCTLYFENNHIHSLTTIIDIDNQDKYLDIPTSYTLRVENRYFINHPTQIKKTMLFYLEEQRDINVQYKGVVSSRYVYTTDSFTVSVEKGRLPGEYTFKLVDTYSQVNGFNIPVWCYGYTSGEILPIPTDFIEITATGPSEITYTEYGKGTYDFTFTYKGNMDLVDVELKTVADDYEYFSSSDFTLKKLSSSTENKKLSYQLGLDKKIFSNPQAVYSFPIRIVFKYSVKRIDASVINWPAETITKTCKLTYVTHRWDISNVSIDNALLGGAAVRYRLKDLLLNQYMDRFSANPILIPKGKTQYSKNATKYADGTDWDARNKYFQDSINITEFGDITFQYIDVVAQSNTITIKHDEPVHPLVVTPNIKTINTNTISRIIVDLKYSEKITLISVNGSYLTRGISIKLNNVKNDYGLMFPLYTPDKKAIIGLAIDVTPLKEEDIHVNLLFTEVNDYDYSQWPVKTTFDIPVKTTPFDFTFTLTDFAFNKNSSGILSLKNTLLADAKIIATVKNKANDVVVARPNFNPIGDGDFETTNIFIDDYLSKQKEYYLDIEIYEYVNASKDNDLPNQLYYTTQLPFKVN